jgi:hypothetical protein
MSAFDRRVKAIRDLSRETGRPVDQILGAVAQSWGLSPFELGQLAQTLGQPQAPAVDPAARQAARAAADTAEQQADTAAVLAFRTYERLREQNPFAAAAHRMRHLAAIDRGRELDTDSDPPPTAA